MEEVSTFLKQEDEKLEKAIEEHAKKVRELRHEVQDHSDAIKACENEITVLETRLHFIQGGKNVMAGMTEKFFPKPSSA
jgi:septal ring factor EnvC (AmiA/AmiB activator)